MTESINDFTILVMIEQPLAFYSDKVIHLVEDKIEIIRESLKSVENDEVNVYLDYVMYSSEELKRRWKVPHRVGDASKIHLNMTNNEPGTKKALERLAQSDIQYDAILLFMFNDDKSSDVKVSLESLEKLLWYKKAIRVAILCGNRNQDYFLSNMFTRNKEHILSLESSENVMKLLKPNEITDILTEDEDNNWDDWTGENEPQDESEEIVMGRMEEVNPSALVSEEFTELNHPGRSKCDMLRNIRKTIAENNGITYEPAECHHTGPCSGTCPVCDSEIEFLSKELLRKKKNGDTIILEGIASEQMKVARIEECNDENIVSVDGGLNFDEGSIDSIDETVESEASDDFGAWD